MTVPNCAMSTGSNNGTVFALVGGGIAGCVQAIHLSEKYPRLKIHIFEKNKEIMSGTSSMNPGRPSFGFHYQHLDTATFCQDNTVKFTKFLERIGCQQIFANAPQRGIYVLMKDGVSILGEPVKPVFSSDEIKPVFEQIKCHAIKNYSNDNFFKKHFGPPDQICRELKKVEYERLLMPEVCKSVGACYETAERTFNTAGICSFIRDYINKCKNITVFTEANVTRLEQIHPLEGAGYCITWNDGRDAKNHCEIVQLLALACWERVGLFRKQLGKPECQPTHNRLKILAIVDVEVMADNLDTIRPMFVASGAFCMMSPQEYIKESGGRIICRCACTLAIRTNLMTVPDNERLPMDYDRMLEGTIGFEEKMEMAKPILEGVQQFFTSLKTARLTDVRFGTVRVPFGAGKNVDLHDPASEHHARDYPGCQRLGDGLFVNEAMKIVYSVYNAEMMMELVGVDIERLKRTRLEASL